MRKLGKLRLFILGQCGLVFNVERTELLVLPQRLQHLDTRGSIVLWDAASTRTSSSFRSATNCSSPASSGSNTDASSSPLSDAGLRALDFCGRDWAKNLIAFMSAL